MRRKLIAGNWKMNNTNKEALELVNQFSTYFYLLERC